MFTRTHKGSVMYYTLAVVIAFAAIAYGLLQYKLMRAQAAAIIDNKNVIITLADKDQKLSQYYTRFSAGQVDTQKQLAASLDHILPIGENYTDLARSFDDFFAQHDSDANPIDQSSLRFGKGEQVDGMKNIGALPITMNLDGTRENFFAFLHFIDSSGSSIAQNRLVAINSIQINFPDGGEVITNSHQVLNVTLDMVAYYRIK